MNANNTHLFQTLHIGYLVFTIDNNNYSVICYNIYVIHTRHTQIVNGLINNLTYDCIVVYKYRKLMHLHVFSGLSY